MNSIDVEVPENFLELLQSQPEQIIGGAWKLLGVKNEYPRHGREILALANAFGYHATNEQLIRAILRNEFQPPEFFGLEMAWKLPDIVRLLMHLDEQRSWLPGFHNSRKTPDELKVDRERILAAKEQVAYFDTLGEGELMDLMRASNCDEQRAKIRSALQNKEEATA